MLKHRDSIDDRPQVVDLKQRMGDWEGDTVIGRNHKKVRWLHWLTGPHAMRWPPCYPATTLMVSRLRLNGY